MNSHAQNFLWAKRIWGNGYETGYGITRDAANNIFVTGNFTGTVDFDPNAGTYNMTASGSYDVFVCKLDANGNFIWARQMGGNNSCFGYGVRTDKNGNVYTYGTYFGTIDLDPGTATANKTANGNRDAFLQKMDSSGNFLWGISIGNANYDEFDNLCIDSNGNVLLAGGFLGSVDFDPGTGVNNVTSSSSSYSDAYILKLNASGSLIWVKTTSGGYGCGGYTLSLDAVGNLYVCGSFSGTVDFNPGSGVFNLTGNGVFNTFLLKLDNNGLFIRAAMLGGYNMSPSSLQIKGGNAYLTGVFSSNVDLDPGSGVSTFNSNGGLDVFIEKIDTQFVYKWGRTFGGTSFENTAFSVIDKYENVYLTGYFKDTVDFNPGAGVFKKVSAGGEDIYTMKMDSASNFVWAKTIGGNLDERGNCLVLDSNYNVYTCGYYNSNNIDLDPDAGTAIFPSWYQDVFIQKLERCIPTARSINITACTSYKSPSGKYTWTSSGTYIDTIFNVSRCDSIITFTLTIKSTSANTVAIAACTKYQSPSNKYTWLTSGTYYDTIPNAVGCDSFITIVLTIKTSSNASYTTASCNSYKSPSGRYVWTSSGSYKDTLVNALGCDSIISINLTIKISTTGNIILSRCTNYLSPSGKYNFTSSGVYKDTIPNVAGCDSIITINLSIKSITNSSLTISSCNNYTSPSGKYTWVNSGVYSDTLLNAKGCDSIITINLTIKNKSTSGINIISCNSYKSPSAKYIWVQSGNYVDTIPNMAGCDSILQISLTINKSSASTINIQRCNSYQSPSKKYTWTQTGVYKDTLLNQSGCDSVITIILTINKTSQNSLNINACHQYQSPSNKFIWKVSGIYQDTILNHTGCDSVLTINLNVQNNDTSITQNGDTLIATPFANYQWLNCAAAYAIIPGQTNQRFIPNSHGSYAVRIIKNGCTDTSSCHAFRKSGIRTSTQNTIKIYPNPGDGTYYFNIENLTLASLKVFDTKGQEMAYTLNRFNDTITLDVPSGIYYLELKEKDIFYRMKLVKW